MSDVQIDWYEESVSLVIDAATEDTLKELALVAEGYIKAQIVENDQVDTGFMLNSVYAFWGSGSNSAQTWDIGEYPGRDELMVERNALGDLKSQSDNKMESGVHIAAGYAQYQDMKQPFVLPGLLGVQSSQPEAIRIVRTKHGL